MFKYFVAVLMMYLGIATMFLPLEPNSDLGIIYETRVTLVLFGLYFFASGATLLIGKIRKMRRVTGHGLFMIYLAYTFGFILNWVGFDFSHAYGNLIGAVIMGALYLRWKHEIYYYQPLDTAENDVVESELPNDDRTK